MDMDLYRGRYPLSLVQVQEGPVVWVVLKQIEGTQRRSAGAARLLMPGMKALDELVPRRERVEPWRHLAHRSIQNRWAMGDRKADC